MRDLDRPKVHLIGEPTIHLPGMLEYLREVGGEAWLDRVFTGRWEDLPAAELLVEFMGRLCYKSWEPGLNKNVTRVREDRGEYIYNVLRSAHGSVLEHATFNFAIRGGSRVFTAEMNRHRAGTAISEQSLRFVRLDDIEFWMPPGLSAETEEDMRRAVETTERIIARIYEREFSDGMSFDDKKKLTSKIRRIAPMGMATEEGWSGNVRAIRHVIEMRTAPQAEEEIRIVAGQIAKLARERAPLLFDDYGLWGPHAGETVWDTQHRKV